MEALTKLMLGGLPTGRVGGLLHCRLRYFDPARHRAGIPEDVAALLRFLGEDPPDDARSSARKASHVRRLPSRRAL